MTDEGPDQRTSEKCATPSLSEREIPTSRRSSSARTKNQNFIVAAQALAVFLNLAVNLVRALLVLGGNVGYRHEAAHCRLKCRSLEVLENSNRSEGHWLSSIRMLVPLPTLCMRWCAVLGGSK